MDSATRKETVQKILVSIPDYMQKVHCDTNERTLPFKCAVHSCRNYFLSFEKRDTYPYKFHNFPTDPELCAAWKQQCGLSENANISQLKVCSDHFELDDYIRNYKEEFKNPSFKRKLKPEAIPQRNLVAVQISTYSDLSNDGTLSFHEIIQAVDENESLKTKHKELIETKCNILRKIELYDKKISSKVKALDTLQEILDKDVAESKYMKNRKNVLYTVFSEAQINLLLGKKKVFWSDDDLAKAFTLRHIGSKECYLYLKNKLNFPLPALACVQKWAASCTNT